MSRVDAELPHAVIPAPLLELHDDFSIDERSTPRHRHDATVTPDPFAITVNDHASEVHAWTIKEQQRTLDMTLEGMAKACR
jgi:4-hydroxy-tetrahydrodipicolinate synthase